MDKIKFASKIFAIVMLVALMVAAILQLQEFATKPKDKYLQGQMEARRVLVAGKVPGRIEKLLVREGQTVKKNALVAVINSPEIEAKKMQAQGALGAAKAQANKAKNGARSEDVKALKAMAERAQDAANLAKNTYERVQKLYNEGVLPLQKRDEAETQMKASQGAADAARAQYEMALAGARDEDKEAAEALVKQAEGANAEVNAYLEETKIGRRRGRGGGHAGNRRDRPEGRLGGIPPAGRFLEKRDQGQDLCFAGTGIERCRGDGGVLHCPRWGLCHLEKLQGKRRL